MGGRSAHRAAAPLVADAHGAPVGMGHLLLGLRMAEHLIGEREEEAKAAGGRTKHMFVTVRRAADGRQTPNLLCPPDGAGSLSRPGPPEGEKPLNARD